MTTEAEFKAELERDGFLVGEISWAPGKVNGTHVHEFTARLLCLEGELTIETGGTSRTYAPGDRFELAAGCEHVERIGAAGARMMVGRRY